MLARVYKQQSCPCKHLIHTKPSAPVGALSCVSACFASHARSCPHPLLSLLPKTPIRYSQYSCIKNRGQSQLIVLLACWSLGLIGLSHFLRRFNMLSLHSSIRSCLSQSQSKSNPTQALVIRYRSISLHSTHSSPLSFPPHSESKKSASPALKGWQQGHSTIVSCHLLLPPSLHSHAARRSTRSLKTLHYHFAFQPLIHRTLKAVFPNVLIASPTALPDHHP